LLFSIENLRPISISLLNVDYNIVTKFIAKGIGKDLLTLINTEQTVYVEGRYIGENVKLIDANKLNQKGFAVFLAETNCCLSKYRFAILTNKYCVPL